MLITSYDLLKRDVELYRDMVFAIQVIDEAQYIKNPGTQAAKGVKQITAGFKLALTGTPIENRLSELWSIFDYLMPVVDERRRTYDKGTVPLPLSCLGTLLFRQEQADDLQGLAQSHIVRKDSAESVLAQCL